MNVFWSIFTLSIILLLLWRKGLRYSMRIKWIAFQSLHLLMFCIPCFGIVIGVFFYSGVTIRLWANNTEERWWSWNRLKFFVLLFLLWHGISIVILYWKSIFVFHSFNSFSLPFDVQSLLFYIVSFLLDSFQRFFDEEKKNSRLRTRTLNGFAQYACVRMN